ncbi:MAG: fimbria/pilus periplasmic chaperone [Acidobacteriota bacterium]
MRSLCLRNSGVVMVVVLGLTAGWAQPTTAATFRVSPVQVVFDGARSSDLLTITNQSSEELRFQITAFTWDQQPSGEMQLTPTNEIVFFPALLSVAPGQERKVRVGLSGAERGNVEKTYRLFFEEMRPIDSAQDGKAQIRVLTKMGVPVFLQPRKVSLKSALEDVRVAGGTLMFDVANGGSVHYMLQGASATGFGADGKKIFQHQFEGWYVLAGGKRSYQTEIPPTDCSQIQKIVVTAQTGVPGTSDFSELKEQILQAAIRCGS